MTADILREAAAVLRERAEAATPGPWGHHIDDDPRAVSSIELRRHVADASMSPDEYMNAAYIATMHPGVGLALADWLELAATAEEIVETFDDRPMTGPQVRVARAILGRDA